jgi:hypothetical protein
MYEIVRNFRTDTIYRIAQTPFADKAIADKELYKSIVIHRERFSKLGGVECGLRFAFST